MHNIMFLHANVCRGFNNLVELRIEGYRDGI